MLPARGTPFGRKSVYRRQLAARKELWIFPFLYSSWAKETEACNVSSSALYLKYPLEVQS